MITEGTTLCALHQVKNQSIPNVENFIIFQKCLII